MHVSPCLPALFIAALSAPAVAQANPTLVLGVERLADGRTLVTDGGSPSGVVPGIPFVVDPDGRLVHAWDVRTTRTHSAEAIGQGRVLVADAGGDRVIEVAADGTILWSSDDVEPFSDGSSLDHPCDADPLPGGNILISDRDNHRVLELDRGGNIVWQFGTTGVPGGGSSQLRRPHNVDRLDSGNTLLCDSDNDRVLEVDPAGSIAWAYAPTGANALDWPRDADRMPSGDTAIADSRNDRIVVVSSAGAVVNAFPTLPLPFDVDPLPGGSFLVGGGRAREYSSVGTVLWEYPPPPGSTIHQPPVHNSTSGVDLFVEVHVPAGAGPADPRPAVVFVPGGSGTGAGFHFQCRDLADLGFVAVHFDPDGRGQSTNGGTYTTEDYNGFLQQDGLREVLAHVAGRPDVDPERVAVYSGSYGVTMASGALARYPADPKVRLFIDWEGPASRGETAQENGGHVPVSVSDHVYWSEREAITFMPSVPCAYVRLQTDFDHHPPHPGNYHAIDLANAALHADFGGAGSSPHVRVGAELSNPAELAWSLGAPPAWIPEDLQMAPFSTFRTQLLLERHLNRPVLSMSGAIVPGESATFELDGGADAAGRDYLLGLAGGPGPSAVNLGGWVGLDIDPLLLTTLRAGVLDAAGTGLEAYAVPADPALSGFSFFAAGFVFSPGDPVPYWPTHTQKVVIP